MDIQKEREAFENKFPVPAHWIDFDGLTCKYICKYNAIDDQALKYQARWESWLVAKAQAVLEGFVLVPVDQLNQWGHMANYAEQYGCPECFEARGYAHTLTCEINEYFAIEAQEPAND